MTKLCINCKHWYYSEAEPDYSEMTPGCDLTSRCMKNHWTLDVWGTTREEYRQTILSAETCKDYDPIKEI